jgi:hypothetical protein
VLSGGGSKGVALDDFVVWSRALSSYEVAAYSRGHVAFENPADDPAPMTVTKGLMAGLSDYWRFDSNDGAWLGNAANTAAPAYATGQTSVESGHFGSELKLGSVTGTGLGGDGLLLLPELEDPVADDACLTP